MLVLPRSGFRYASFDGPIPGGLTAGTLLLVIVTASGTALAAGSALEGVIQEQRPDALILLTLLAGLIMVGAAFVHVGRYFRFVSHWLRTLFRLVESWITTDSRSNSRRLREAANLLRL